MDEIDLMEIGSYTELPGGNIQLPGGYSAILGPLMKDIPPECILKGHAVTKIRWRPAEGAIIEEKEERRDSAGGKPLCLSENSSPARKRKQKVEVVCENGKVFYAENVICTVPLGVLKEKGREMFEPPLPDYKLDSVDKLCFGVVDKIYLEYERPFLNPDLKEIIFLWDVTDGTE
ncbi:UNVERIFIED_CONTAM: hypothetical protein GTU68_044991, partial [Idotea baltica]|nr:hypothetical protein [Idotea baltica]